MSPRLGWIQAFLCVVEHFDFKLAGRDLGVSDKTAHKRVLDLEAWLHKVLILDDVTPPELSDSDGVPFLEIARDVLKRFEAACPAHPNELSGRYATRQAKKIAFINLDDLQRFLRVAEFGSYKAAASVLGCSVTTVQSSIKALEELTKTRLLGGRTSLELTDEGKTFKETASYIVKELLDFRADIPASYNPDRATIENLFRQNRIFLAELRAIHKLVLKTGKKQRGRVRLIDVQRDLNHSQKLNDYLVEHFGPFDQVSGVDIVIDLLKNA